MIYFKMSNYVNIDDISYSTYILYHELHPEEDAQCHCYDSMVILRWRGENGFEMMRIMMNNERKEKDLSNNIECEDDKSSQRSKIYCGIELLVGGAHGINNVMRMAESSVCPVSDVVRVWEWIWNSELPPSVEGINPLYGDITDKST